MRDFFGLNLNGFVVQDKTSRYSHRQLPYPPQQSLYAACCVFIFIFLNIQNTFFRVGNNIFLVHKRVNYKEKGPTMYKNCNYSTTF